MALTDSAHAALLLEVRRGLVECYAAIINTIRDNAADPRMQRMTAEDALTVTANVLECERARLSEAKDTGQR